MLVYHCQLSSMRVKTAEDGASQPSGDGDFGVVKQYNHKLMMYCVSIQHNGIYKLCALCALCYHLDLPLAPKPHKLCAPMLTSRSVQRNSIYKLCT
jgi:hypothetical protein